MSHEILQGWATIAPDFMQNRILTPHGKGKAKKEEQNRIQSIKADLNT